MVLVSNSFANQPYITEASNSQTSGDINKDGQIDATDLAKALYNSGKTGEYSDGDVNGNGIIDENDIILIVNDYGLSCEKLRSTYPLALSNKVKERDFIISPNPVIKTLNFKFNTTPSKIDIFDSYGNLKLSKKLDISKGIYTYKIDVSSLQQGIYIIYLYSNGETSFKKFVKNSY